MFLKLQQMSKAVNAKNFYLMLMVVVMLIADIMLFVSCSEDNDEKIFLFNQWEMTNKEDYNYPLPKECEGVVWEFIKTDKQIFLCKQYCKMSDGKWYAYKEGKITIFTASENSGTIEFVFEGSEYQYTINGNTLMLSNEGKVYKFKLTKGVVGRGYVNYYPK